MKAHRRVQVAKAKGKLAPQPCEVCGAERVHAHHDDYDRPLEVRWLCPTHHSEWHAQYTAMNRSDRSVILGLTAELLAQIDEARFESRTKSRREWIRGAIQERLERDKKRK